MQDLGLQGQGQALPLCSFFRKQTAHLYVSRDESQPGMNIVRGLKILSFTDTSLKRFWDKVSLLETIFIPPEVKFLKQTVPNTV